MRACAPEHSQAEPFWFLTDRRVRLPSQDQTPAAEASLHHVRRELLLVGVSAYLFFVTYALSFPVLPRFVIDVLGGGDAAVGAIFGVYALGGVLIRPLIGRIGDRFDRRVLLVAGGLITSLGLVLHIPVTAVVPLMVMRMLAGVGQAAVVVAGSTLALDLAPPGRRGEAATYIMVAMQLGMGTGPLLGELLLGATSYATIWVVSAVGALLCALTGLRVSADPPSTTVPETRIRQSRALLHPAGLRTGLVSSLGTVSSAGFLAFVPLLALDLGMANVGGVLFAASFIAGVARLAGARLPDRIGPIRAGRDSQMLMAAGLLLIAVLQSPMGLYIGAVVMAFGHALSTPAMVLAGSEVTPEPERARMIATLTLFIDLSTAIGPAVLGLVAAVSGYSSAFVVAAMFPALGAVLIRYWIQPWLQAGRRMANSDHALSDATAHGMLK